MPESESNSPLLTPTTAQPLSHVANGIAQALEDLASKVRKGQLSGFSVSWIGGPTMMAFTQPAKAGESMDPNTVPEPDPNDPAVKRGAEVSAYFDGMFRALNENKQWGPKISERIRAELPDAWKKTVEAGEAADVAGRQYREGAVEDPKVYQAAIDAMGTAWREAHELLKALPEPAAASVANGRASPGTTEHPF